MDRSFAHLNRATSERLHALAARADDHLLMRPLDGGEWTVAVALAHVAYWDGRTLATLEVSRRHAIPRAWWDTAEADAVNAARLARWRSTPPHDCLEHAIRTAEALDAYLEALPDDELAALARERPLAVDRSRHRASHLDEIDAALDA
jgi:hypothetical protein